MSKDLNKENTTKEVEKMSSETKKLSKEEKKQLRRQQMSENGRLTLPDEYKEKGYRYRVCNVLPGVIENWKSKGYEIVTHDMRSGSGSLEHPEVNGVPTEFEVGGARGSMKAVWMRTTEENGEILDEIAAEDAAAQESQIYENPLPKDNQYDGRFGGGTVTKENLR